MGIFKGVLPQGWVRLSGVEPVDDTTWRQLARRYDDEYSRVVPDWIRRLVTEQNSLVPSFAMAVCDAVSCLEDGERRKATEKVYHYSTKGGFTYPIAYDFDRAAVIGDPRLLLGVDGRLGYLPVFAGVAQYALSGSYESIQLVAALRKVTENKPLADGNTSRTELKEFITNWITYLESRGLECATC